MATLNIKRGDDLHVNFTLRDPKNEDGTLGDPIDITGYDVVFTVDIGGELTVVDNTDGIDVTPLEGLMEVHVEGEATAEWGRSGTWKLVLTSPEVDVKTIGPGNLRVS